MMTCSLFQRGRKQSGRVAQYFPLVLFLSLASFQALVAQSNWSCISNLNITLDEECGKDLTIDMLLTGASADGFDHHIRVNGVDTNRVAGCGNHTYELDLLENGEVIFSCWGSLFAEDKTAPNLECPPNTAEATLVEDMQVLRGELTVDSPSFFPATTGCFQETAPSLAPGEYYYQTYEFRINSPDTYTFIGVADFDGMLAIYSEAFNASEPCQNLLAVVDNTFLGSVDDFNPIMPSIPPSFRLQLGLDPDFTYHLVFTSRNPQVLGEHAITVFADQNGRIMNLSKSQILVSAELVCLNLDDIYLNTFYEYATDSNGDLILAFGDPYRIQEELRRVLRVTGYPTVSDNCSAMIVSVHDDLVEEDECADWVITRTFRVRDRYHSNCDEPVLETVCQQIITVRKPTLDDVIFPPYTTTIECDEAFESDGIQGGPDDNPAPSITGYPYLDAAGSFYDIEPTACNLGAVYTDGPRIQECPGSYSFRREWTVLDWCNPGTDHIYAQYIRVGDFTGPDIQLPYPDADLDGQADTSFIFNTAPNDCVSYVLLPTPTVVDSNNCSGVELVSAAVTNTNGELLQIASPAEIVPLAPGDYLLRYCAQDGCGNEGCAVFNLQVRDRIAPTVACVDVVNLSLDGNGVASLSADDLHEGTYDNCGPVSITIRRSIDAPWNNEVFFDCSDLQDSVDIYLQVVDTSGNENTCWLRVLPEDKLRPECFAPADQSLNCNEWPLLFTGDIGIAYLSDFHNTSVMMSELFGTATGTDNCQVDTIVERNPNVQLNECGWGTITRRFEAWQLRPAGDLNNNGQIDEAEVWSSTTQCQQVITLSETHDFVIDFPEDRNATCTDPDFNNLLTQADGCDVLVVNQSDPIRYEAFGTECYQLAIQYDVINWCLWDGETTGTQILRRTEEDGTLPAQIGVEGNERPVLSYSSAEGTRLDRRHTDRDGNSSLPDNDENDAEGQAYEGDIAAGRYQYTQFLRVYDETPPTITPVATTTNTTLCAPLELGQFAVSPSTCTAQVAIRWQLEDVCDLSGTTDNTNIRLLRAELDRAAFDANEDGIIDATEFIRDEDITAQLVAQAGQLDLSIELPFLPAYEERLLHTVRVLVEDGCGNRTSTYFPIQLIDCQVPAPICIHDLSINLQTTADDNCELAIWASDFIASPIYDCNGQGSETDDNGQRMVTSYAIYRTIDVLAAGDQFIPSPEANGLLLTAEDNQFTAVRIYSFDAAGNYNFCETNVNVLRDNCPGADGIISGVILTRDGQGIGDIPVQVSGDETQTVTSNLSGSYQVEGLSTGTDFSLTPYFDEDHLNGVSTLDLILMSKHILGVQPFDSPYQYIAADVNRSGNISTLDLINLRKVILNVEPTFPNNTSWRFVLADYAFPTPSDPWAEAFPELLNINNFTDNLTQDFIAIKVGDVNGTVITN